MSKKKCKCECPAGEKWAVPFADFLSLLLALFIALYALASANIEKQKALKDEFIKIYNFNAAADTLKEQDKSEKSTTDDPNDDSEEGQKMIMEAYSKLDELENKRIKGGHIIESSEGSIMTIPAQLIFESGKADITNEHAPSFLKRLAKLFETLPSDTEINVKGYAEENEVKKSKYQDALDLSTARANNVIRELIRLNIPRDRLFSSGFGASNSSNLKDKKVVVFELHTMKNFENSGEVDIESIFDKIRDEK
ncbi:flagellar motor stator protein [Aliarcobacter faecis]|uniref:flagellar motor protein MotB n=1 Tax=Aliarcobacter faecis TaxID=1564138 RepID=UPI00047D3E56|nr:flagellar motor protein MotB [Aliarcobacter faecis]QKF73968.1 flagellar motor stator protein [Aliarcobacter faecis]